MFADPRVRQAAAWAFDFEWTNKNLFYGLYTRAGSYFSNTDLAATGLPEPEELALLEPFRASLPPELFTEPFVLPVTDGTGNIADKLKAAYALLLQAGYSLKERKLVDADGGQMAFSIMVDEPLMERVLLPYLENVKKLGIDATLKLVDPGQYLHLSDAFDYDAVVMIYLGDEIPGNDLRDFWSCAAARQEGSNNVTGTCEPVVDALVEKVVTAPDRATLRNAARALDRVLLWRWYNVPMYGNNADWVAWWDKFGRPEKPIREGFNFDTWWVDTARAEALSAARKAD
jgi:microcin C transport system substrate-binding protein